MKKLISIVLVLCMLSLCLTACNGNGETTTEQSSTVDTTTDSTTESTTADDTTVSETTNETTTDENVESVTTDATSESTTAFDNNGEVEYNENGILKSYMGAFDAMTLSADSEKSYRITANDLMKYDATIVIYFTQTCGVCKAMIQQFLEPYYRQYGKNVLVLGVLQSARLNNYQSLSIAQWLANGGITMPVIITGYYGDNGVNTAAVGGEGIGSLGTGVPQTYVLTNKGKLYSSYYGFSTDVANAIQRDVRFLSQANKPA